MESAKLFTTFALLSVLMAYMRFGAILRTQISLQNVFALRQSYFFSVNTSVNPYRLIKDDAPASRTASSCTPTTVVRDGRSEINCLPASLRPDLYVR